jgi:RNA polymerase sigma factor (sigma-70 family)
MVANDDDAPSGRMLSDSTRQQLQAVYAVHEGCVRRYLRGFGVLAADLDDVSQEVFLVVMGKEEQLLQIRRVDLWLREICRKAAAGARRRGGRQREVAVDSVPEITSDDAAPQFAALEQQEEADRLHQAMSALDDEARDLIALHELGGLPLVDVAALVERDRKTVSKRLREAQRRLTRLFQRLEQPPIPSNGAPRFLVPSVTSTGREAPLSLEVLAIGADISIGLVGPVLVAVWPGPPTIEALTLLDEQILKAVCRLGSGLVYLAIVEASTSTPSLEARQKITRMLREHSEDFGVYVHVLLGGFSWIARPIMAGLSLLAGIPAPTPFFGSIQRASNWLTAGYLRSTTGNSEAITRAIQELRVVAATRTPKAS